MVRLYWIDKDSNVERTSLSSIKGDKLPSFKRMIRRSNVRINSKEDIKNHMEEIKIHVRGHNLFDIFYGKYKKNEDEIINKYIEEATILSSEEVEE